MIKERKQYILEKDLPGCPKGRKFLEDIDGNYCLSITYDEHIEGEIKIYKFTKSEIESNPDWFRERSD